MKKLYLYILLLVSSLSLLACSTETSTREQQQDLENIDIAYTPEGKKVGLTIVTTNDDQVKDSLTFPLKGKLDVSKYELPAIFIELTKDGYVWQKTLPVENGEFSDDIPLFFGNGIHELKIHFVGDLNNVQFLDELTEDILQVGATVLIDNESGDWEHIRYETVFQERGIQLDTPSTSKEQADLTFRVAGSLDKETPYGKKTSHLGITMSKDGEYAEDVIPIKDATFDKEFYLRFGPGKYFVTISAPDLKDPYRDPFDYTEVAQFFVENTSPEDVRHTAPSRGIESEDPTIIALAHELVNDTMSDRENAKAIYDYTATSISYNTGKYYFIGNTWDDSALNTLKFKNGICLDYAYLATALLRAAGMEARVIYGTAGYGDEHGGHAWVEVIVDGQWLTMDPTWGAGYVYEKRFEPFYSEDFFDPTDEAFETHVWESVAY